MSDEKTLHDLRIAETNAFLRESVMVLDLHQRIKRLEECLRVIARSSIDRFSRRDAEMALAGDPRKRD